MKRTLTSGRVLNQLKWKAASLSRCSKRVTDASKLAHQFVGLLQQDLTEKDSIIYRLNKENAALKKKLGLPEHSQIAGYVFEKFEMPRHEVLKMEITRILPLRQSLDWQERSVLSRIKNSLHRAPTPNDRTVASMVLGYRPYGMGKKADMLIEAALAQFNFSVKEANQALRP